MYASTKILSHNILSEGEEDQTIESKYPEGSNIYSTTCRKLRSRVYARMCLCVSVSEICSCIEENSETSDASSTFHSCAFFCRFMLFLREGDCIVCLISYVCVCVCVNTRVAKI